MRYLLNAIPGAIVGDSGVMLDISPMKPEWIGTVVSAIGHQSTADLVSKILRRPIPMNRISTPVMKPGDIHYLALYRGPRLPEGAVTLPEGATIDFFQIRAYKGGRWPCFDGGCSNCAGQFGLRDDFDGTEVFECPCPHHKAMRIDLYREAHV